MKLQITPEWLESKLGGDCEEPGGIMACSPFLYAWMEAEMYADVHSAIPHIIRVSLLEYRDRHTGNNEDMFISMMERAIKFGNRQIRRAKMPC